MFDQSNEIESVPVEGDESGAELVRLRIRKRLAGSRLDRYLRGRFPRMSRTVLQKLIKDGGITVNGMPTKSSYEPGAGDVVEVLIPPPIPTEVVPEDIPLTVLYEDDWMLAINKQVGIICHPSRYGQTGTLANALAHYANQLSQGSDAFRPGIVHRLDKNTTGVMLVAKCDEAHWRLSLQFERRSIQKTYMALVEGEVGLDGDIIDMPVASSPLLQDRYITVGRNTNGLIFKEAITRYEVVERFAGFTLVQMFPRTGRTHQLRVHMSSRGHPMMGDTQYGGHLFSERDITGDDTRPTDPLFSHQCLHALRISFTHPILETPVTLEAPLRDDLMAVTDLLRRHRNSNATKAS